MSVEAELIDSLGAADSVVTLISEGPNFIIYTSDVERVKGIFRHHGMSFAVRNSRVNAAERLVWTCKDIDYFGKPFKVVKRTTLECKYGMKRKPADHSNVQLDQSGKKKRSRMKPSKKTGCPAIMKIAELILYPGYAIDPNIQKNLCDIKERMMRKLRDSLETTDVPSEIRYFITVSKPSEHEHCIQPTRATYEPFVIENVEDDRSGDSVMDECYFSVGGNECSDGVVDESSFRGRGNECADDVEEDSHFSVAGNKCDDGVVEDECNFIVRGNECADSVVEDCRRRHFSLQYNDGADDVVEDDDHFSLRGDECADSAVEDDSHFIIQGNEPADSVVQLSFNSRSCLPKKEIIYNHDLELEANFSRTQLSRLRETAKSVLDLTYLISLEDHDLSEVHELLSNAETLLARKLIDDNEIPPAPKKRRM